MLLRFERSSCGEVILSRPWRKADEPFSAAAAAPFYKGSPPRPCWTIRVAAGEAGTLYVESSAVLAWLFGEPTSATVGERLNEAQALISSELTVVECSRAIHQAVARSALSQTVASGLENDLATISKSWEILRLMPSVLARARQSFPHEPIRTLDALHVASALEARAAYPELAVLSLDGRVRNVATALGFLVTPQ
ncbi:MAG TPA: type II toxin-antitoxin system VapC family toxin [Alphaproteobacteria bacterium]|nr:type II toxin-antitoxin system VapC family toxin [Alphaproteobacteria bacterium]